MSSEFFGYVYHFREMRSYFKFNLEKQYNILRGDGMCSDEEREESILQRTPRYRNPDDYPIVLKEGLECLNDW